MEIPKIKFYVEKTRFWTQSAVVLLVLATVFQVVGCWGLWMDRYLLISQIVLPAASFIGFALLLTFCGKSALWLTAFPFLSGVGYYTLSIWFAEDRLVVIIALIYAVVAVVLYFGTVFTLIRTKWLLVPLFLLPFLYRAFYRDVLILQETGGMVIFTDAMREIGLLCALLALSLTAIGMRKLVKEKQPKTSAYEIAGRAPVPSEPPTPPAPAAETAEAPGYEAYDTDDGETDGQ